jgi:hypothetical protein
MIPRSTVVVGTYLIACVGLTGLSDLLDERLKTETGLVQSVVADVDGERATLLRRTTSRIDLSFLDDNPRLPRRFFDARWDGVWYVPDDLSVDVYAGGDDFVAVRIDDELVLERGVTAGMDVASRRLALASGLHRLSVEYVQRGGAHGLNVQWAPSGGRPGPFYAEHLFPTTPTPEQIVRNLRLVLFWRFAMAAWIVPPIAYLLWIGIPAVAHFRRYRLPAAARCVWHWYTSVAGERWASPNAGTRTHQRTWTLLGVAVVVLLFGMPLFIGLGSEDLHNDEAIYSYAVDRIIESGEWLTPESSPQTAFPGDPGDRREAFFEKPPLKFWIVALPIRLGLLPHDEFGLRFWDGVFAVIAFVYVFLIGRRLVDPVCGIAAVFLLLVHFPLMFGHGLRSNVMEAALVLSYAGGIYHFLAWSESDRPSTRRIHIFSVAGWFTLGFMTKFVAVGFLPVVVGTTALCVRDWRQRLLVDVRWWAAAAGTAIILIVPWFAYEYATHGSRFWDIMFGAHVYDRMRGTLAPSHTQPWSYYYAELYRHLDSAGALGWVIVGAVLWVLESVRRRWKGGVLVLAWYLIPIGIISMSVAKLYHYSFPFLPAVALVGAYPISLVARFAQRLYVHASWSEWTTRSAWLRPVRYVVVALPVIFLLYAWPVGQYGAMLRAFESGRRPMSVLRTCLVNEFNTLQATSPNVVSRVYMHLPGGRGLIHPFYYYYRVFDQWEHLESPSDADLFARIFVPSHRSVSLVPLDEYEAFLERIESPELEAELQAWATEPGNAAFADGYDFKSLTAISPTGVQITGAGLSGVVFVLPGPLSRCADVAAREGAVLVRAE